MGTVKKLFDAFFRPHFYAGAKAEDIFEQQAHAEKPPWPMERISQAKERMPVYKGAAGGGSVKRGDFICRSCNHAEIEVKCMTKYEDPRLGYFYYVEENHIRRHKNMKKITNAPVVFAFYERKKGSVLVDTLRMVDLDFLLKSSDYKKGKLSCVVRRDDKKTKCIKVPFRYTREGFEVLDILFKKKGIIKPAGHKSWRRSRPRRDAGGL